MMLTLKQTLQCEKYARALRAIGQDLAGLFPELIEIQTAEDTFVVHGQGREDGQPMVKQDATPAPSKGWKKLLSRNGVVDVDSAPSVVPFSRTYTPQSIDRLQAAVAARRKTSSNDKPDLYSLAERLRMVGRILDANGGKLIKLFKDGNTVVFYYQDQGGEAHREEISNLALYKLQQEYYSERGSAEVKDPWEWAGSL